MPAGRPTMYDVARAAGVSHQTVSRVMNGSALVSPDTKQRVLEAVRKLEYVPNETARRLRARDSDRIGVLAHQLTATGPAGITATAMQELQDAGFTLDVVYLETDDRAAVVQAMQRFRSSTRGVLAMAQTAPVRSAVEDVPLSIPVYIDHGLDRGTPEEPGAEELIGQAAAQHLADLGHHRVLHLPGPTDSLAARLRWEAFQVAATNRGMAVSLLPEGDWSTASGARTGTTIDLGEATAVFVSNDAMAIGLLHTLRDRGIRVPNDISVLGADDIPEAAHVTPALSSVAHDLSAEGRLAAHTLIADLTNSPRPRSNQLLDVQVRARASTAPRPPGSNRATRHD